MDGHDARLPGTPPRTPRPRTPHPRRRHGRIMRGRLIRLAVGFTGGFIGTLIGLTLTLIR